jgi:hypothetical protein
MSKTINSQPFDIYSAVGDVVQLHDFTGKKDTLAYKRTAPKRVKDFPGMAKSELKLTRVDPATGALVGIVTVSTSIRADASDADKTALQAIIKSAEADAAWEALVEDQRLPLVVG